MDFTVVRARQRAADARRGTNQVDPVLRNLLVRLEEAVKSANAWDGPETASPPRPTSRPKGDAPLAIVLTPGRYGGGPQSECLLELISVPTRLPPQSGEKAISTSASSA
ncbi:hypothetical protein [Streptomyces sp. OR43]|uniref:hypothetical protein n=1 Tax=Streptomyces sp. or43 TaxID=2478957 RepID=UPI0011CDC436|nr:hypothetical protein [Streptomyces sp. or43]